MLVATGCGIGCAPVASGTFGSIAALPLGWALHALGGAPAVASAAVLCFVAGLWAANRIVARSGIEDPGFIVIDEIAAQLLVLAMLPAVPLAYAIGLAAFRVTDIMKPFPAGWCDSNIGGGFGVMLDDLVAGIQAAAIAVIACHLLGRGGPLDVLFHP
jgi:phosphatidylglycerophosphatase A